VFTITKRIVKAVQEQKATAGNVQACQL